MNPAAPFLSALCGVPDPAVTFQTFDDSPAGRKHLAQIYHGRLSEYEPILAALNDQGAGVFVTVNETNLRGRKKANVIALRALFCDFDAPSVPGWALPPSALVSPARGPHPYWFLEPGAALELFEPAQRQLATFYHSDPQVHDLPRVMRLPGFYHRKGEPRLVLLEECLGSHYALEAILAAHPVAPVAPLPRPLQVSSDPHPLSERVYRARRYVAAMAPSIAGQGGHADKWAAALAAVRGFDLSVSEAFEALAEFNERCVPPWSDRELLHALEDAFERGRVPGGYLLGDRPGGDRQNPPVLAHERPKEATPPVEPPPVAPPPVEPPGPPQPGPPQPGPPQPGPPQPGPPQPGPPQPADPATLAEAAILGGRPVPEIIHHLSRVRSDLQRDGLIARLAHDRALRPISIRGEIRRLRGGMRRLRAVDTPAGPEAPQIELTPGMLHVTVEQASRALLGAEPVIYQRGGQLVRVQRTERATVARGVSRPEGALQVITCDTPYLRSRLTSCARFLKPDARSMDLVACNAPAEVAEVILSSRGEWRFPVLVGILEAPTLRPDGSILSEPGYDEATGLLFDPGATVFPEIPSDPTREDATRALELLLRPLQGFPFVDPHDRSAALSAILSALVRRSLRACPMHTFSAPKMRSGKTLLVELVGLIATGRAPAVLSEAAHSAPDEDRKRLLSVLLAGDSVICWDNILRPFSSAAICQALTAETIQDRVLGGSTMATASTAALLLATGNNLVLEGDLTARVVPCVIDPATERPEERLVDLDGRPLEDLHAALADPASELYRPRLVAAALTLLRAYVAAGRPPVDVPRWGGFDDWSVTVRAPLVWLGLPDPALGRRALETHDPTRERLRTLLETWYALLASATVTVSAFVEAARNTLHEEALREYFAARGTQDLDARAIGNYLKRHADRIENDLSFHRGGSVYTGALTWFVSRSGNRPIKRSVGDNRGLSVPLEGVVKSIDLTVQGKELAGALLTPTDPWSCPRCGGTDFRLSKSSSTRICVACWPLPAYLADGD